MSNDTLRRRSQSELHRTRDLAENTRPKKRLRSSIEPDSDELARLDTDNHILNGRDGETDDFETATNITVSGTNIHPKATIQEAKAATRLRISFAQLSVSPWLIASLAALQVKRPTGIQAGCIPEILKGRDCIGGSKTGSGKTIAFAVPILQKWSEDPFGVYAVVLTPTRELALQIQEQILALGSPYSIKCALVTGGADMREQAIAIAARPHIIVATPGRLADHIRTSGSDVVAGIKRVRIVVFDEADRLLAPGSGSMLPDVEECLSAMPPARERQTCLFTATVTDEVRALKERPRDPERPEVFICEVDTHSVAVPAGLSQTYLLAPVMQREVYLHTLLSTPANESRSIIIFVNTTATAQILEYTLRSLEHKVTALHSSLPQKERVGNLGRFRARAARLLVATDVASRGLDIPAVELVINYDVPRDPNAYIHRVGRTARAGRGGTAITLVGQRDVELVLAIEARVGSKMEAYDEGERVSIEGRVIRDGLKAVGEAKREAVMNLEQGRTATGAKKRAKLKPVGT